VTRFTLARGAAYGVACLLAAAAPLAASAQRPGGGGRRGIDISALGSPDEFYVPPKFAGNPAYDGRFTFARIKYRGFRHWSGSEGPGWAHDYPEADEHLMRILKEVTSVHPFIEEGKVRGGAIVALDDPNLFRYPVSYLSEPGGWYPTDAEVKGMRAYLLKGGFMIVDDFGAQDWANFSTQIGRVLPNVRPVTLTGKEPIFDSFYKVDVSNVRSYRGRAVFMGIYENNDPKKRLMMILNVSADIGESWQWAGTGFMAVDVSNEGFKLGVNYLVYSLTH
jgi:hypothetical protein